MGVFDVFASTGSVMTCRSRGEKVSEYKCDRENERKNPLFYGMTPYYMNSNGSVI